MKLLEIEGLQKPQDLHVSPFTLAARGSIENANGVLRRDLPRKTDLADYSQQDIHDIVWAINTTPRKCLGFLTPAEAFLTHHRCCT